jgi:hypothetical protein
MNRCSESSASVVDVADVETGPSERSISVSMNAAMFYAEFEREGRLQSAESAVPTHVTKAITNLPSA